MKQLLRGIHRFQTQTFERQKEYFQDLAAGQHPTALFISCSDSRVVPDLITSTKPGELFAVRNVGNIVPPHGVPSAEEAAIEYAVQVIGVRDIIVCGHSKCGAIQALLHPEAAAAVPAVRSWLRHADAAKRIIAENYAHLSEDDQWNIAVQENVLAQIESILTLPVVASHTLKGDLRVHGWVYKIETGVIFAYDSDQQQFLPIIRSEESVSLPFSSHHLRSV